MDPLLFVIIFISIILAAVLIMLLLSKNKPTLPKGAFFVNNKINHHMTIVSSLTLTSWLAQVLGLAVIDTSNNNQQIPGTISEVALSSSDATIDTAVDGSPVDSVGIDPVAATGSATITAVFQFASTKLLADGVTPAVQGQFTATVSVTNNIVVTPQGVFVQN